MSKSLIPSINISSIIKNGFENPNSIKTINKIKKACIDIGFFQVTGHGISRNKIQNICNVGNKFFNSSKNNKRKLSPKKWNNKNKNIYRGYFPNDVNGKEGLDIGDLKVTKKYAAIKKKQYIEYINLKKSFDKKSIKILSKYFDEIFNLGETLFKCIIKLYDKNINNNEIYVCQGVNNKLLFSKSLECESISWINNNKIKYPINCYLQVRHQHTPVKCVINKIKKDLKLFLMNQ